MQVDFSFAIIGDTMIGILKSFLVKVYSSEILF